MRCTVFLATALALFLCVASTGHAQESQDAGYDSGLGQKIPGFRELGIDLTVWDWLEYGISSQSQQRTSWGNEFEIDVTKTFFQRVSLAADIEFIDYDDDRYVQAEQLFSSILISRDNGTLVTIGKFNAPFGVERRDFWDRLTGTPSLLFRAQPEDIRGAMATVPIDKTGVTLQPFMLSGFGDEAYIPGYPSTGLMATYKPNEQWTFGLTNWFGPGLEGNSEYSDSGSTGSSYGYGPLPKTIDYNYGNDSSSTGHSSYNNSVFELTNVWKNPKYASAKTGLLYFLEPTVTWKPRHDLTIQGEYLLATSNYDGGVAWTGVMLLVNYDIDSRWRAFAQWSFINDPKGEVYDYGQQRQEVNTGLAYRIDSHWELRGEYRHDWSTQSGGIDSFSMHLSVGY